MSEVNFINSPHSAVTTAFRRDLDQALDEATQSYFSVARFDSGTTTQAIATGGSAKQIVFDDFDSNLNNMGCTLDSGDIALPETWYARGWIDVVARVLWANDASSLATHCRRMYVQQYSDQLPAWVTLAQSESVFIDGSSDETDGSAQEITCGCRIVPSTTGVKFRLAVWHNAGQSINVERDSFGVFSPILQVVRRGYP